MLQVGDRVINKGTPRGGEMGTIIDAQEGRANPYLVEYDNYIDGHDGNNVSLVLGKFGYCWWERKGVLEKIDSDIKDDNILNVICDKLGVDVGEMFKMKPIGEDKQSFRLDKLYGLEVYNKSAEIWVSVGNHIYSDFITGRIKPVWKPKEGEYFFVPSLYSKEEHRCDGLKYKKGCSLHEWYIDNKLAFQTSEEAIETTNKMLNSIKENK